MGIYVNPDNIDFQRAVYLRKPTTSFRQINGSKYAHRLLQPWL